MAPWAINCGSPRETLLSAQAWAAMLAEFIATFLFVYIGCGAVISSGIVDPTLDGARLLAISIAHGLAIGVLVASICGVSGGHVNPAVTFGFVVSGNMTILKGLMYWAAQVSGGILGAGLLKTAIPKAYLGGLGAHGLSSAINVKEAFVTEMMLTFILVWVIFGAAVDKRGPNSVAPVAIGFSILIDHLVGVPLTGASMNPARTLGPALWTGNWNNHWLYWVAPFTGAALASIIYCLAILPDPFPKQPDPSVTHHEDGHVEHTKP